MRHKNNDVVRKYIEIYNGLHFGYRALEKKMPGKNKSKNYYKNHKSNKLIDIQKYLSYTIENN